MENNQAQGAATFRSVAIIVMAVVIAAAISVATYFISTGLHDIKQSSKIITVKGQAEKTVQSNEARLVIRFETSAASVAEFSAAVSVAQDEIKAFLVTQGFKEYEIRRGNVQMKDMLAQQSGSDKKSARFAGSGEITVSSDNVTLAGTTKDSIAQLLQKGIPISGSSLQYYFTDLESVKSDMLKEATANARTVAAAFAENAGVRIKTVQSASQDVFQITEPVDEHAPTAGSDADASSLNKKVRVIVNVDFATSD